MTDKSFDLSMLLINAKIVQALGLAYSVHQPRSKDEMTKALVCVVPGSYFSAVEPARPTPFVRVSFAYPTDDVLVEGFRRLATVLRKQHAA